MRGHQGDQRTRPAFWLAIFLAAAAAAHAGCAGAARGDHAAAEPFDVGMASFAGYAPLFLAQEKGFFEGLDVRFQRIEEIPTMRAAVARGELEAYLATPDIALDSNTRPPGVAVWALDESAGGDGVVVAGEVAGGAQGLAALKGKKVAAEPGLPPYFMLLYLLHESGMSVNDVALQDMTTQSAAAAFASSSVDAAAIYEPYLSTSLKQRKGSRVVLSSKQTPGLIVDLVFVREEALRARPGDVAKLVEGWRKALAFIEQSPDEAYPIMAKAFGLPTEEFKEVVSGIRWLNLADNRRLFGTDEEPGQLYKTFGAVGEVLRRNRAGVYRARAEEHLQPSVIRAAK